MLPDSTTDMGSVLDEVCTAFALVPVLTLINWRPHSGGGGGTPSPPFPDNTAASKFEMPLYIGDITKHNGILQLTCAPPLCCVAMLRDRPTADAPPGGLYHTPVSEAWISVQQRRLRDFSAEATARLKPDMFPAVVCALRVSSPMVHACQYTHEYGMSSFVMHAGHAYRSRYSKLSKHGARRV